MAGHMSDEMVQELKASFDLFDETNSGFVDAGRMPLLLRATGETPTELQIGRVVDSAHAHGGKFSFDQFVSVIRTMRETEGRPSTSDVEAAFRVFDVAGCGFLHRDELKRVLTSFGEKLSGEEVDALISVADVDADGRVNYAKLAEKLLS